MDIQYVPNDDWHPKISFRVYATRTDRGFEIDVPFLESEHIYFGSRRMLSVSFGELGVATEVRVFDIEKHDGGLWKWLNQQYWKWRNPTPTARGGL
jgi:hypothetical protein